MKFKKLGLLCLAGVTAVSLASCGEKGYVNKMDYTYNTYTLLTPSNWNELTYQDNNDTDILNFIVSPFFNFDYKYDSAGNILDGQFTVNYAAATKLEDVTTTYAGNENYSVPADEKTGYAWKFTLRDDLKWDDGTAIVAGDFVYTMKQQLDPLFQNYRADSYYKGATVIHNAKEYLFQGQSDVFPADTAYSTYSTDLDSKLTFKLGPNSKEQPNAVASFRDSIGAPATMTAPAIAAWIVSNGTDAAFNVEVAAKMEGKTLAEIKADAELKAGWDALIGWWQTDPDEELDFFVANYTFPEVSFDKVGIFATSDTELVLVLDNPLELLEEDGSLSYLAAYNMSGLPLVKEDLYEANKHEPAVGATVWTTTYNQSVDSTASWGPYKLVYFQAGKQYVLEKNENWWGYDVYKGQYQTENIICEQVEDWNTAWLKFQAGEVDSCSIDVSISSDYRNSEQAIFTPSDFVSSMQLQSSQEALKARESAGINKQLLANVKFRKALSLALDRSRYAAEVTTSSQAGFGLYNSMHYYDVAHGGRYRDTDVAKKVLCDTYGVNVDDFDTLDEAYASITGFNLTLARQLVDEAVDEAIADGSYNGTDTVQINFGTGAISEAVTRQFNFIKNSWLTLVQGTKLAGKLELPDVEDHGEEWAEDFRGGGYDVCMGGWTGAAWDPGYFLAAYLDKANMYSAAWDTETQTMTFTMPRGGANGEDIELTMSLMRWYRCLNGQDATYNWASGRIDDEARCALIAALEGEVLKMYYTVPIVNSFTSTLVSYKWEYKSRSYNTFMGYGGVRYITYNYTNAEWNQFVKSQGGRIDYSA
ncbi:MAG: hypothetical protein K2N64_06650 [Anaeroplasmataceae bacterium]|nr:hypothetical protein [Anaeroplasmataceae bacterium]